MHISKLSYHSLCFFQILINMEERKNSVLCMFLNQLFTFSFFFQSRITGKIKISEKTLIYLPAYFMELQNLELPFYRQKMSWYLSACEKSSVQRDRDRALTRLLMENLGQQQETALESSQDWLYC